MLSGSVSAKDPGIEPENDVMVAKAKGLDYACSLPEN